LYLEIPEEHRYLGKSENVGELWEQLSKRKKKRGEKKRLGRGVTKGPIHADKGKTHKALSVMCPLENGMKKNHAKRKVSDLLTTGRT